MPKTINVDISIYYMDEESIGVVDASLDSEPIDGFTYTFPLDERDEALAAFDNIKTLLDSTLI
jgi:hypothetical protein